MVHILIIALGIAAFFLSDVHSSSTVFSFVLPLVFLITVLYAMGLGVVIMRGKGLPRQDRESEALRFWAHMSADLKPTLPKAPPPSAGSNPARPGTPPAPSLSDRE